MLLIDSVKASLSNFYHDKKRAFLTMLGIIIGVSSVIIIISAGAGAQSLIINEINSFGSNIFGVLPGAAKEDGPPASVMGITVTTLKLKEIDDLKKIPHVTAVSAYVRGVGTLSYQGQKTDATFVGVNASLPQIENITLAHGRFFNPAEVASLAHVAVLGSQVKNDLFGQDSPAVGANIKIKRHTFKVIGVMAPMGNMAFDNKDALVYIPITTAQKIMLGINHVSLIRGKIDNADYTDFVINEVKKTIRRHHHINNPDNDDFSVRSMAQALSTLDSVTNALRFFLAGIAAISLIVGGIGIMNIMLVNVTERTKEIGLRKAVGATRYKILQQFLIESAAITLSGGLIGVLLGILISWLAALLIQHLGYAWEFKLSLISILIALSVSVLIGLVFGLYPANQAAKLEPVEALRDE